jgi:mono/diheme cytochrome c family protein
MTDKWTLGLLTTLLLCCGLLAYGHAPAQETAAPKPSGEERDKLVAAGGKIFVERCAKCHNERGDKPLSSGAPLNERKLSDEELTRAVSGRLKDAPAENKRAVILYISSFMKNR